MRSYLAEMIGTFSLVFAGTGAIVANDLYGGTITELGIALTFGLIVMTMIYTIGDVSGAHINPAVTIAFWMSKRLAGAKVVPYLVSQIAGAILASLLIKILFMEHQTLGATLPSGTWYQSFVLEIILTFLLMFVILNVSAGAKEKGITAGIAIGAIVGLEAMFAGPISGASMNPARSLGPALISGNFADLWIYLAAPIIGAVLAVPGCICVQPSGCCSPAGADQC